MKKRLSLSVMGEKFELELEEEFFEFVKEDLIKLQNPTPKEILFLILEKDKKIYETDEKIKNLIEKLEKVKKFQNKAE
jgi:predicted nucleotidyltransferase